MTPSDDSNRSAAEDFAVVRQLREQHEVRIYLPVATPAIDVVPFCGPAAGEVMIRWYDLCSAMYLTPAAALALASALTKTAEITANPEAARMDKGDSDGA